MNKTGSESLSIANLDTRISPNFESHYHTLLFYVCNGTMFNIDWPICVLFPYRERCCVQFLKDGVNRHTI